MTLGLGEWDQETTSINSLTLGDTAYASYIDLEQSNIGFFRLAALEKLNHSVEQIKDWYDADNVSVFPPPLPKKKVRSDIGSGVVLLSAELWWSPIGLEEGKNIREWIMTDAWKEMLMILLNRISEVKPIKGHSIYYSLSRHLAVFWKTTHHIFADDYEILYYTLSKLRNLDSRDIFYQQWDDTVDRVRKIKFDNNWDSETYLIKDFCDAFEYILRTNQMSNITSSKLAIS